MSLRPYPEYKDSGVEWLGELPAGWEVNPTKRIAELTYGDALGQENRDDEGSVPVFGSNGAFGSHNTPNTEAPVIFIGRKGSC